MVKRFTIEEAQSLIPQVDRLLREAVSLMSGYQDSQRELQTLAERITMMGGMAVNRDPIIDSKSRRDAAGTRLKSVLEQVQELGCLVKDLGTGLVDFPTLYRGEEVCLCWKRGEQTIGFWHGMNETYGERKAIDQDFRDHHRGDRAD